MVAAVKNGKSASKPASKKTTVTKECVTPPQCGVPGAKPKNPLPHTTRIRVHSPEPLEFRVREDDIAAALCKNPNACVVARAIKRAIGPALQDIEVGARSTRLVYADMVVVYRTSNTLRKALIDFDNTGLWSLPPGWYRLNRDVPSKDRNSIRGEYKKRPGPKRPQDVFKAIATPTRRVRNVSELVKIGKV